MYIIHRTSYILNKCRIIIYHDVLLNASITVRRGATNLGSFKVVLSVVILICNKAQSYAICMRIDEDNRRENKLQ